MSDQRKKKAQNIFLYIFMVFIGLLVWELLVRMLEVPHYILPTPTAIWGSLVENYSLIMTNFWTTLQEILIGYVITIVISIPLAVAVSYWEFLERTLYPILVTIQLIPKVAIAPLFVIWFGFGMFPKILMVFLLSFFPLVVNSILGFQSINHRLIYMARSITDSEFKIFWRIRFPSALPNIFAGLKISIAFATVAAIVGEFVGADAGLGYLLQRANGVMNTELLFADLIVLSVMGIALYFTVIGLERVIMPWKNYERKLTDGGSATM